MTKIKYGQKILTNTLKRSGTNSINTWKDTTLIIIKEMQVKSTMKYYISQSLECSYQDLLSIDENGQ